MVLALVNLIDQIDTSILRGVVPYIQDDFELSDAAVGLLGSAFVLVNALATIPAGWVADRYRRTTIVGFTLLSWSALSALSAGARSYPQLLAARASLGIGQAVDDPASTSLLADYYPADVRGRAFSLQQVMVFLGLGLGIGLGGLVGGTLGWRWAFVIVGMPGSFIAVLCFRLREPRRGEADGRGEAAAREDGAVGGARSPGAFLAEAGRSLVAEMRMIFGIRTMRYVLIGVATLLFTVSGVGFWLSSYHDRYSGFTEGEGAAVSALVLAVGGIAGTLWGGARADRAYGGGYAGRILLVSNAIIACALGFLASFLVPWVPLRLALQLAGVFAIASAFPGLRAAMMDVTPVDSRGVSASAFALASTVFGTALAPYLVGALSDATGSLVGAFYLVTPPVLVGSLILRRAQHTITEDAGAILAAVLASQPEADRR